MDNGYLFAGIVVLILFTSLLSRFINSVRYSKKIKAQIVHRWGKEPKKVKPEKLKFIATYFNDTYREKAQQHSIDNITWNDLDMDRIFMRINNTGSSVGEEYLYSLLREPVFDVETLKERGRLIEFFQKNPAQREKLQLALAKLGKIDDINISDYFTGSAPKPTGRGILYNLLGLIAFVAPAAIIFNFPLGLMVFIIAFAVNMTLYYQSKNELGSRLESLNYVVRLIQCAKNVIQTDIPEIRDSIRTLSISYKNLKPISKKAFNLLYTSGDVFVEYVKIAYLRELASYESISRLLARYNEDLRVIYETIGLLDSLVSVASFRESLNYWCVPDLEGDSRKLVSKKAYHPLIKDPVSNSLETDKSLLITGSNASGKSTFIKTTAINALLAQSIYTCLAEEYSTCLFKVFSSMALRDDLMSSESYYIAEIKSLKRIFDHLENNLPCLCFIDEVLRGTNTIERIAASSQVLFSLSQSNCLCITATHDIELTRMLEDNFINYHFQEQITDEGITFDYKLYPGRSHTRNAIKLLKFIGYDESIVTSAEDRAQKFLAEGKWDKVR